jgi:hypothetical protein
MQGIERQAFTVPEVAQLLGYHQDAVRYWVRVGELQGRHDQTRGDWVVASDDLLSFLRGNGEAVPETIASQH